MNEKINFPITSPAIRIMQPFGEFYITKLSARVLLEVSYSDPLRIAETKSSNFLYPLIGAQRKQRLNRLKEIGRYINTVEAAFPNSIILGVNYDEEGNLEEDDQYRWTIKYNNENGRIEDAHIVIPTSKKLASIIDGQHRLNGFKEASSERHSMELLCAIYFDLPNPYQAYLFATINFNQKKVDRSLAYELWGYNLEDEQPNSWSPEKVAVFLCRKLNMDEESPFFKHIIIAAQNDEILLKSRQNEVQWKVSTATIVDGILKLISSNPQKDKDEMHKKRIEEGRSRKSLKIDNSPLRRLYLETNDLAIYKAITNFFSAANTTLWSRAFNNSYITKTVGIQALFDVLRLLMADFEANKNISLNYFESVLAKVSEIDFSDQFFQASGKGRTRIKNSIAFKAGLIEKEKLPQDDLLDYLRIGA